MLVFEKEEYIVPTLNIIDLVKVDIVTTSKFIDQESTADEGDVDDPFGDGDI